MSDINRAAIVARINKTVGALVKGSASLLDDVTALCAGIKAEDFADVLGREIGAARVGRVLARGDAASLVQMLRDDARDGGKVKVADVASVLGISTGQVSTLANMSEDGESGDANTRAPKTADELLAEVLATLKKAAAKDDARSEAALLLWQQIALTTRAALPGTHGGNMGGQA